MPFQPAIDCFSLTINVAIGAKAMANVLNFIVPGGYNQTTLDNCAFAADLAVGTYYLPLLQPALQYQNCHVRGLALPIDIESYGSASAGPGTSSGGAMPANAAGVLTLRTGHTGRSARGRFYSLPTTDVHSAGAFLWVHAYMVSLQSFLSALDAGLAANGANLVVLSRFTAGALRLAALATPVTNIEIRNDLVDSQRNRLASNH